MNRIILLGNLGADPDTRYMPSGTAATNFSVATNRRWKDKATGDKKEEVSWHRCVAFSKTAELIQEHFSKGNKILVEGRMRYGSYEDREGIKRYTAEIVVQNFEFVESKGSSSGGDSRPHPAGEESRPTPPPADIPETGTQEEFDDDIPF